MTTHKLRMGMRITNPFPPPRPKTHPSDKGLPYFLRRCLEPGHEGTRIMFLRKFGKHGSTRKGRRHICLNCFNNNRRNYPNQKKYYREKRNVILESIVLGFYKIIEDPHRLFTNGIFRKYDFGYSFAGRDIWAPNTIIEDNDGSRYTLQYEPRPGLLRDDGLFFRYNKRRNRFMKEK